MDEASKQAPSRGGTGRSRHAGAGRHRRAAPIRPFSQSLPMRLMLAREAVMQRFRPHLQRRGLTDQQWRIIRALSEVDSLEILSLSQRCAIHPASLSRILPKLDAAGLIARRSNETDKRRVIVSLTGKGADLFAEIAPESEEIYARIAADIGPDLMEEVYRVLDEMTRALAERSGSDVP